MLSVFVKILTLSAIFIFFVSCNEKYSQSPSTSSGSSSQAKTLSGPGGMRWASSTIGNNGLDVYLSAEMLSEFDSQDYTDGLNPAQQMLKEWNNSIDSGVIFNIESASDENVIDGTQRVDLLDYNDNIFGIYKHEDWFHDVSRSALAITQFFGKRINPNTENEYLELIHADIIINYSGEFNFSTNGDAVGTYDLQSVILHELGHFIGLGHASYDETSIMVPYLDPGVEKRNLYPYDDTTVNNLYDIKSESSNLALKAGGFVVSGMAIRHEEEPRKAEVVQGIIELMASGECNHYIEGELVHSH